MKKKTLNIPELSVQEMPEALRELTKKLNSANQELAQTNRKLNEANQELSDANNRLYQMNQELTEANRDLDDSNRRLNEFNESVMQADFRRKRFYANISHDLRAPITAISNITEYLLTQYTEDETDSGNTEYDKIKSQGAESADTDSKDRNPSEGKRAETRRMLQIVQVRTEYLKQMVNDVFLLSSLDSTEEKLRKEPVDMGFFLEDFFYMCQADAVYEEADLRLAIDDDLDCMLNIDPKLMHRVLDNLFTNALKYAGEHPIIILGAYQDLPTNQLVFYVEDHGKGIAADKLESIFEWSSRGDQARTPGGPSGSGFGLAIVRIIVERHHGTVTCTSVPGEQTRFSIRLPLK